MVPTLFGVTVLVFALMRMLPGDVVNQIAGENATLTEERRAEIRRELGLDRPWYEQYGRWVAGIVRGDLGESLQSRVPVTEELANRLPVTLELSLLGILFSLVIALPIGIMAAVRQDSLLDYLARSTAITFISIPSFWLATMVIVYPSMWWGWAPPLQYADLWEDPVKNLNMMLIPALILGFSLSGTVMRLTRAQMLEVLRQDYIRTAHAKGLHARAVLVRHALKNALIPVVTLIGLQLPVLVGGTVILETIFSIPGMGSYFVFSIRTLDYPVVQSVNLLIAAVVVFANLLVDLTYSYLDPRVRYS